MLQYSEEQSNLLSAEAEDTQGKAIIQKIKTEAYKNTITVTHISLRLK